MLRIIIAVVAGVFIGAAVTFAVENVGHAVFPPPEGVDLKDPGVMKSIMSQIPLGAKIAVLLAWFVGVLAGGAAALRISRGWAPVAWIVAGTLFAMAAITMLTIPHPAWMMAGAVAATLAGGWGAVRLTGASYARPTPPPAPTPKM